MANEDELRFDSAPDVLQMGGVHENTVLPYLARSPFFDNVSNNRTLEAQASTNPSRTYIVETRKTMEATLRQMQGLEYMTVASPLEYTGEAPPGQGRWVICKQNRRKLAGRDDDISILALYYVIGTAIYKAPSVANVLRSRMLTASSSLSKLVDTAASLPTFSPTSGHTYFACNSKQGISDKSGRQSTRDTPLPSSSREASPQVSSQPHSDGSKPVQQPSSTDIQTFVESFNQFQRYRNEYMDESSSMNEPGSLGVVTSKQHLRP